MQRNARRNLGKTGAMEADATHKRRCERQGVEYKVQRSVGTHIFENCLLRKYLRSFDEYGSQSVSWNTFCASETVCASIIKRNGDKSIEV